MKRKAYSRGERENMILDVFYSMVGDGKDPHMTAYGMAKALGMNSAQHVRNIMEGMVKRNVLTFTEEKHRPNADKKVYCPTPLIWIVRDEPSLEPLFRVNGKVVK